MAIKVGESAPDIVLKNQRGEEVRLSNYLGTKNVAVAFFPLAWTPV